MAASKVAERQLPSSVSKWNIASGTVTADNPPLVITQTWNNSGVIFTAMELNLTDTASSAGSLFIDLQLGGTSKFSVDKNGSVQMVSFNASSFASVAGSSVLTDARLVPVARQVVATPGGGNINVGLANGPIAAIGLQLFRSCV